MASQRENTVDLYGIWAGSESEPLVREQLELDRTLEPDFRFKRRPL